MHILVTCDSYKDCLSAKEVGEALILGIKEGKEGMVITHIPMADGGEGSLQSIRSVKSLEVVMCNTLDPLLRPITSVYMYDPIEKVAYIEMASASGIELLSLQERNCMHTSTFGTGMMVRDANEKGITNVVFFIGGSATNDMGIGMLAALGVNFKDKHGQVIKHPSGKDLSRIRTIDHLESLSHLKFNLICDVENPLYGPRGATYTYGPQKGASKRELDLLEQGIIHFNELLKSKKGRDYSNFKGSGAAGGIGAMVMYAFNTEVRKGVEFMMDHLALNDKIASADLVITGEGKMDTQTLHGKMIHGISKQCRLHNKKLIAVCGLINLDQPELNQLGVQESYSLSHITNHAPYTPESTKKILYQVGREIAVNNI